MEKMKTRIAYRTKWIRTPLFGIIIAAVAVTAALIKAVETSGGPK